MKNRVNILAVAVMAMVVGAVVGCSNPNQEPPPSNPEESSFETINNGDGVLLTTIIVRDKVQGCEYLVVKSGNGVTINPRMESNGTQGCSYVP